MFSTILKEISGYFDRRALISAFFPGLVFWGLTAIALLNRQMGWRAAVDWWQALPGIAQAVLLVAFFVWVTFWTFLTLNFHTALVRLYEGYWPKTGLFRPLYRWKRTLWQARWDELDQRDRLLEEQEIVLHAEQAAYGALKQWLAEAPAAPDRPDADQIGRDLDAFLARLEAALPALDARAPLEEGSGPGRWLRTWWRRRRRALAAVQAGETTISRLAALSQVLRQWWRRAAPYLPENANSAPAAWQERQRWLDEATIRLIGLLDYQSGEVEERRLQLNRDLFLYYPPQRDGVMPTQLGNVLKASEAYAQERYRLDAVVIWPRLQAFLPQEFSDSLRDAKTSLDLMVTLSASALLFGLPLALWLATGPVSPAVLASPWRWSLPLLLAIVGLLLGLRIVSLLLLAAFILAFPPAAAALARLSASTGVTTAVVQLPTMLILSAGVLALARLSYHNAVQAALAYSERIKAAFDLYRWKALAGLGLQLPPDWREERKMWEQVCGLLYRSYAPDSRYYRYVEQENTKKPVAGPPAGECLPVPARPLPALHPIAAADLAEVDTPLGEIPAGAVRERSAIEGKCSLKPLAVGRPVERRWLVEPQRLANTVAIGLPVGPDQALGGALQAGDVVDVLFTAQPGGERPSAQPALFEGLLVLHVQAPLSAEGAEKSPPERVYVVVVAAPQEQRDELIARSSSERIWLTRRNTLSGDR